MHCVVCSSPVKANTFICVYASSTARKTQANGLEPHVNSSECSKYFTGKFTRGRHASLPATGMQKQLLLQQKDFQLQAEVPTTARKIPAIASSLSITPQVISPANCRYANLHPAGEVTYNLRLLLFAVETIRVYSPKQ